MTFDWTSKTDDLFGLKKEPPRSIWKTTFAFRAPEGHAQESSYRGAWARFQILRQNTAEQTPKTYHYAAIQKMDKALTGKNTSLGGKPKSEPPKQLSKFDIACRILVPLNFWGIWGDRIRDFHY